jgi:hypothetical protein
MGADTETLRTNAEPGDVASIDAIVAALYDVISGPAGARDWARLRSLYLDGARLIPTGVRPTGRDGLEVMTVEAYIDGARPFLATKAFYEVEIARRTERFGNIAHAFSTYEARREPEGEPFMRGINSIQLLERDGRWWVVTVFWDNETAEKPIPPEYLPARS